VLVVFEDARWIDPTSREPLDLTVDWARSLPVVLIVTFRPGVSAVLDRAHEAESDPSIGEIRSEAQRLPK
jgi:predicted ATPase